MKIICTDNFDRDNHSDTLIAENVNKFNGEIIVKLLNGNEPPFTDNWYVLVEDNYVLHDGNPN